MAERVPTLPPPRPKSPPDLYGKRRELAKVQMLEREINYLEGELKFVESLHPASRCCKEVADFVVAGSDPFMPISEKTHRSCSCSCSCSLWKWLCRAPCLFLSSVCCFGCNIHLKKPQCCNCNVSNCYPSCLNCAIPKCLNCSIPKCLNCSIPKCLNCSIPKCLNCSIPKCLNCSIPNCRNCSIPKCRNCSIPKCRNCSIPKCQNCPCPRSQCLGDTSCNGECCLPRCFRCSDCSCKCRFSFPDVNLCCCTNICC